ncbi:MAG: Gfo/Idh/MocA family oxidoreductase [Candidatus Hydrogenedentota bacterium]
MNERGMTRRDFGKVGVAAGFAAWTARKAAAQTNSDTLRIGLIGCGGRGSGAARDMLNERNENVQLIALADVFEDRLNGTRNNLENHDNEAISGRTNVDDDHCFVGLDAYQRLLETDVDVVIHGTPPYARPQHIEAIIDAGKHLFTEKPAAVDPVGIRRVIAAADKAEEEGLSFVAGTQRRHQQEYIETIEQIQDGAIGEILAMQAYWAGGLPFARERQDGWSDLEYRIRNWIPYCWTSGSNIVEQHVHNLDIMNWVKNDHPQSVFASGGRAWMPEEERYGDIWDNFSCDFEYADGTHMYSFSRWWPGGSDGSVHEHVVGTEGESNCRDMGESGINPYVQEHIDLVNSIRGDGPYYNEGRQVAYSTMCAIMGRMSAYTGRRILWEEAMESDHSIVPDELDFDLEYPVDPVPVPGDA